jgi:hypothetical protein
VTGHSCYMWMVRGEGVTFAVVEQGSCCWWAAVVTVDGLSCLPCDVLGVWPSNPPQVGRWGRWWFKRVPPPGAGGGGGVKV